MTTTYCLVSEFRNELALSFPLAVTFRMRKPLEREHTKPALEYKP